MENARLIASAAASPRRLPIVAVVGTTGVGKSQVAIDIACAIRDGVGPFSPSGHNPAAGTAPDTHWRPTSAEVISADSMQVYRGLPIATNKVTQEEARGIKHHLIDFMDLGHEYGVREFVDDAQRLIASMHARSTLPIIVGGTNYYVQSLLWEATLASESLLPHSGDEDADTPPNNREHTEDSRDPALLARVRLALDETDAEVPGEASPALAQAQARSRRLHALLAEVDPKMAATRHPNDERKIRRSLEVWLQTAHTHSSILSQQRATHESNSTLRYPTLLLWLHAPFTHLTPRLDARCETMVASGLVDEVRAVRAWERSAYPASGPAPDRTRGIFQAIGYKEFSAYLDAEEAGAGKDGEGTRKDTDKAEMDWLWGEGVEGVKLATRQYARRQIAWIKNKMAWKVLRHGGGGGGTEGGEGGGGGSGGGGGGEGGEGGGGGGEAGGVGGGVGRGDEDAAYVLDASDLSLWSDRVLQPALSLTHAFLHHLPLPSPTSIHPSSAALLSPSASSAPIADPGFETRTCPVCTERDGTPKVLVGRTAWEGHVKGRRHREGVRRAAGGGRRGRGRGLVGVGETVIMGNGTAETGVDVLFEMEQDE
ncbi:IPPT-domain-containing protein [Gonapodya prolifera JEL478]|uniref:IPPT-domain-containing protein n=1 Tax=Gonapodya prolifera (strain JEL478) TaxID=1344416 RepID=A0A139A1H0_GONPJ|nr:IPPT-domain-containing protein [Gonapodya prolifera JEL478]|eukprot:KXS10385.1 IPPT-domain-containing protein [Gonapodya prolifera JEL478]